MMSVQSVDIRNINYMRVIFSKEQAKTIPFKSFVKTCEKVLKISDF